MKKVLLIDDDKVIVQEISDRIKGEGFEIIVPDTNCLADNAKALVRDTKFDIAICDLTLPDSSGALSPLVGMALMKEIRAKSRKTPIVALSGSVDEVALQSLTKIGVTASVCKDQPDAVRALIGLIKELCS